MTQAGELLIDSHFKPASHVSCSTTLKCSIATNGLKYMNFHLPRTKMKEKGDEVNVTDSTCPCSATATLEHHLASNVSVPASTPLFAFKLADGLWAPMECAWFLDRCNAIWEKDGLSSMKGHGFHICGTTHLLLLGIDPWVVMVQGRWSSQSFLSYWHRWGHPLSVHWFFLSVT